MRNQALLSAAPKSGVPAPLSSGPDPFSEGGGGGDSSPPGMSIAQVISILWAYRFISAIIACTVLVIGVTVTKFLPKTYTATATLMVNNNISDPLAGKTADERVPWTFIPTEMQLMESPEVLLAVVDKLNLTQQREFMGGCRGGGVEFQRCVAGNLYRTLLVDQGPQGSLLVDVTAAAHDPALAAVIANSVADTYLEYQRKRLEDPDIERAKRYAQQLTKLEENVHAAQAQVADFRQRTGVVNLSAQTNGAVVDLAAQTTVEEDTLAGLQHKLDDAQAARRGAEVKAMGNPLLSPEVLASDSVRGLKAQLATEKTKLAELSSTLGSNHPKVKELLAQIQTTQTELDAEVATLTRSNSAAIVSESELEKKLKAAIAQQKEKVLAVRKLHDEGNQYVLALESAQAVYKRALDGYDQIMFASAGKYNYVTLVTRAVAPVNAARPNKPKLALLAAVMGLGCGIVIPFAYELFVNRRVRCHNDLEVALGVRVLADFGSSPLIPHPA